MGLVWQIGGGTKEWKGRGPADGRGDGMLQTRAAVAVSRQGAFVAPALPFFRQYACAPWASIPVPPPPSSGVPSLVSCLSLTSSRHFSPRPHTLSVLPTLPYALPTIRSSSAASELGCRIAALRPHLTSSNNGTNRGSSLSAAWNHRPQLHSSCLR